MTKAKKRKTNTKFVAVLVIAFVSLIVAGIAWHTGMAKKPSAPVLPLGMPLPNTPQGNLDNAYKYGGRYFPNLSARYQFVYRTTTAVPANPPDSVEADYTTKQTVKQTYNDIEAVCRAHKFTFTNAGETVSYPNIECSDRSDIWLFNIGPASSLIDEPWYQQKYGWQSIAALYGSVRVQIESGEVIIE